MVALESLLLLGWENVGSVKRMVCGLLGIWAATAAEGRGLVTSAAVGDTVEARRYRLERAVSLMPAIGEHVGQTGLPVGYER